ncbi:cytochrome P450 [Streptomyces sp. NPDC059740]|uniref:cytochrome P450 n=1 Tax=Streptomyces sp. NPDC059740 TaxID=3346926 RepID=UPI003667EB64
MTSSAPVTGPTSDLDLFADDVLTDPYPAYATLRELGPAVWLPNVGEGVWAVPRYDEARTVLGDSDTFTAVDGIALTEFANQQILRGTVLASDGPAHVRLRRPLSRQLSPRALRDLADGVRARAVTAVDEQVRRSRFDAADLARDFVADVVMELMGLPPETREELIHGAAATFDVFGPDNARHRSAAPVAAAVIAFLHEKVSRDTVTPGSWMAAVYAAIDAGQLTEDDGVPLMSAYTAAGMDTTIYAISRAVHLLATHPDQWEHLRTGRARPEGAFHEAIRLYAPVQGFGRRATRTTDLGGVRVRQGEQLWVLYGSSGRDRRKWGPDADAFRVSRPDAADQLALGTGPHSCAGNHLAALQATAVIEALVSRCTRIEADGEPVPALNNVLQGLASVPVRVTRDRA